MRHVSGGLHRRILLLPALCLLRKGGRAPCGRGEQQPAQVEHLHLPSPACSAQLRLTPNACTGLSMGLILSPFTSTCETVRRLALLRRYWSAENEFPDPYLAGYSETIP